MHTDVLMLFSSLSHTHSHVTTLLIKTLNTSPPLPLSHTLFFYSEFISYLHNLISMIQQSQNRINFYLTRLTYLFIKIYLQAFHLYHICFFPQLNISVPRRAPQTITSNLASVNY